MPNTTIPQTNMRLDFPQGLDSTMISSFKSCEKAFWYNYIRRIMGKSKSVHLVAGGAFASGCEAFRKHYWVEGNRDWTSALGAGSIALIKHWGNYEPHPKDGKTLDAMLAALAEYFTVNHPETDPIKPYFNKGKDGVVAPAAEINFALPIEGTKHPTTGEPILYTGRMDLIGVYNDKAYAVDEKTTQRLGEQWVEQWKLRSQFTGYTWAAQQHGFPVVGAIVRGISILSKSFGHATVPIVKQPWQIEQWHEQLVKDVNRMIAAWEANDYHLNLGDACTAYSGCAYRQLCLSRDPEVWIPNHYRHNPWDPLKTHEEMEEEKAYMDENFFTSDEYAGESLDELKPFG